MDVSKYASTIGESHREQHQKTVRFPEIFNRHSNALRRPTSNDSSLNVLERDAVGSLN